MKRIKISSLWKGIGDPSKPLKYYDQSQERSEKLSNCQSLNGLTKEGVWIIKRSVRGEKKLSTWVHKDVAKDVIAWFLDLQLNFFELVQQNEFIPKELKPPRCTFPKHFPEVVKTLIRDFYPCLKIPQISSRNLKTLQKRYLQSLAEMAGRDYSKFEFRRTIPLPILLQLICIIPISEDPQLFHGIKWNCKNPAVGKYVFEGNFKEPYFDTYISTTSKEVRRQLLGDYSKISDEDWDGHTNLFEKMDACPFRRDFETIQYYFHEFSKDWAMENGIIKTRDEEFLNWLSGFKTYLKFRS
jgi:hypothetical protein